jgi:hydrogenase-4 membrane subunit HyfE
VNDQIEPADAARALSEIARRREQVIRRTAVPRWFWWASAVLAIALVAGIESQRGALFWTGIALYTVGTLAINGLLFRAVRGAPLRPDLDARSVPRVLAGTAALVAVVFGVGLATRLSLEAVGVPYPGMIASAVAMAALVAGGQMLMRYRAAFLLRQPGGRG